MNDNTLYQKIRDIEIETKTLAEDFLRGAWRSSFKGRGLEFEEVREYRDGDDIRTVDWNVFARTGKPHVKLFREERELSVILALDISPSMQFSSTKMTVREVAARAGGALAFSAIKNNDNVGVCLFSNTVDHFLAPKSGVRHTLRVIRDLLTFQATDEGHKRAAPFLGKALLKRAILFYISDFLDDIDEKSFLPLAKKHDLIFIWTHDPYWKQLPESGVINVTDSETGESGAYDAKAYRDAVMTSTQKKREVLVRLSNGIGASLIELDTSLPIFPPLQKFFKTRIRR